ncbi:hypothetical protein [Rhizobium sp. BR 315]|uniref:hypothetical protein n=1 Tax=Rhizobium sp. BR 315 TaxID=3040014 RepID=UPI003D345AA5
MGDDALKVKAGRWTIRIAKGVAWISVILSFLALFAGDFAHGFIPSVEWASTTNSLRLAIGLISTLVALRVALKILFTSSDRILAKVGAVLVAPLMSFMFASGVVICGPIILAIFAGHHVELPYKVEQATGTGRRGCRSPVYLQGLPFVFNSLCGVSEEFRQSLKPGMPIIVEGRGTSYGVFASDYRQIGP